MIGRQAAQTVTVCAPQQISIPEGALPAELLHCNCRGCLGFVGGQFKTRHVLAAACKHSIIRHTCHTASLATSASQS